MTVSTRKSAAVCDNAKAKCGRRTYHRPPLARRAASKKSAVPKPKRAVTDKAAAPVPMEIDSRAKPKRVVADKAAALVPMEIDSRAKPKRVVTDKAAAPVPMEIDSRAKPKQVVSNKATAPVPMEIDSRAKPKRAILKAAATVSMDIESRAKRSVGAAFDEAVVVTETKRRRVEVPALAAVPTKPAPCVARRSTRLATVKSEPTVPSIALACNKQNDMEDDKNIAPATTTSSTHFRLAAPAVEPTTVTTTAPAPVQTAPAPIPLAQPNAVVHSTLTVQHNVQPVAAPQQHPQAAAPGPIAPAPQPQNQAVRQVALQEAWDSGLIFLLQAAIKIQCVLVICFSAYALFNLHDFLFEGSSTETSFTDPISNVLFDDLPTEPIESVFMDLTIQGNSDMFENNLDMFQGNSDMSAATVTADAWAWLATTFGHTITRGIGCVAAHGALLAMAAPILLQTSHTDPARMDQLLALDQQKDRFLSEVWNELEQHHPEVAASVENVISGLS
jgi:hypothetical protein